MSLPPAPVSATSTDGRRTQNVDVLIVGAGFSGLYMLLLVRQLGVSVRLLEAGAGVGGTWYWNRYPGARCDVESTDYQYGFDDDLVQEWTWSERYGSQPEILALPEPRRRPVRAPATTSSSRRASRAAAFDEATSRWTVDDSSSGSVVLGAASA